MSECASERCIREKGSELPSYRAMVCRKESVVLWAIQEYLRTYRPRKTYVWVEVFISVMAESCR